MQDARYIAKEHRDVRRDCLSVARHINVRYIAMEHMDVRRDCLSVARHYDVRYIAMEHMEKVKPGRR